MYENETLAIVGESGCGKSVTAMSILGLVDEPGKIGEDSKIMYGDKNLATLKDDEIRKIRGNDISMSFSGADDFTEPGIHSRKSDYGEYPAA